MCFLCFRLGFNHIMKIFLSPKEKLEDDEDITKYKLNNNQGKVYSLLHIFYCYIHTEKYSPQRYFVNFRTQISSSQSEERTMVFTCEKNDMSNQNRERCFFTCEKNDTSNQKPKRCVSFGPKFPPFIAACSAASHTFNEKSFTQRVFLAKK